GFQGHDLRPGVLGNAEQELVDAEALFRDIGESGCENALKRPAIPHKPFGAVSLRLHLLRHGDRLYGLQIISQPEFLDLQLAPVEEALKRLAVRHLELEQLGRHAVVVAAVKLPDQRGLLMSAPGDPTDAYVVAPRYEAVE